jgi:hypothetical protein
MSDQIRFTKKQRDRAKADGNPLTAICFEDRHLTKDQGGSVGRIAWIGPMGKAKAKRLLDFMLNLCKEPG